MKEYYRMQVKLDYLRDADIIELLKNAKNKQEVLRQLYNYASFYGVVREIAKRTKGKDKR